MAATAAGTLNAVVAPKSPPGVRELWRTAAVQYFFKSFASITALEFEPEELEEALESTRSPTPTLLLTVTKRLVELALNRKRPIEHSSLMTHLKQVADAHSNDLEDALGEGTSDRIGAFPSWEPADKVELLYLLSCWSLEESESLRQLINEAKDDNPVLRTNAIGQDATNAFYYQLAADSARLYRQKSMTKWEVVSTTVEELEAFVESALMSQTNRKERTLRTILVEQTIPAAIDRLRRKELQAKRLQRVSRNLLAEAETLVVEGKRRTRQPVSYKEVAMDDDEFEATIAAMNKWPVKKRDPIAAPLSTSRSRSERAAARSAVDTESTDDQESEQEEEEEEEDEENEDGSDENAQESGSASEEDEGNGHVFAVKRPRKTNVVLDDDEEDEEEEEEEKKRQLEKKPRGRSSMYVEVNVAPRRPARSQPAKRAAPPAKGRPRKVVRSDEDASDESDSYVDSDDEDAGSSSSSSSSEEEDDGRRRSSRTATQVSYRSRRIRDEDILDSADDTDASSAAGEDSVDDFDE